MSVETTYRGCKESLGQEEPPHKGRATKIATYIVYENY